MPRGELSLEEFSGAPDSLEALPEGLDFGNDFEETEDDADIESTDAADADADSDAADDAGDGGDAAGDQLDDATDGDEADAEPDADGADEEPAPAVKEKGSKEPKIPKSRLDQSIRKQRVAEQRAQELEAELAQMRSAAAEAARPKRLSGDEIKAKMAEANEALIGGDTEKAAAIQAELFGALAPQEAPVEQAPAVDLAAQVEERIEFKAMVKEVYARFPELDENHELFNEELGSESVELQRSYLNRGFSMVEATRKAAEAVAKLNDLEDRQAQKVEKPATPSKDKLLQDAKTKQKVANAAKAPPPLAGKTRGEGSDKININDLSEDEFMALPDSVRNKMLGVTV